MAQIQSNNPFYDSINKHLNFVVDLDLNADGDKTIKLINNTINRYSQSAFIKKCVAAINEISHDDFSFCKALFEVCCKLVKYRRDPDGHEIVFTPQLLMQVRQGDCKKFTTFICCVLKCKGIPTANKVVNYDENFGWQHIYALANLGNNKLLILDPVNHEQFNKEVWYRIGRINYLDGTYSDKMSKLSMMGAAPQKNLTFFGLGQSADDIMGDLEAISGRSYMAGIGEVEQSYIQGVSEEIDGPADDMSGLDEIGKKSKQQRQEKRAANKTKRVEKRKKILKGAKKVGFTPVRAAFLTLIGAGALLAKHTPIKFNLAVKIAELWKKDNGKTVKDIWTKFGGKTESIKKALEKAANTQLNGIGEPLSAGAVIAAVAAASPILALIIKALYKNGILKKDAAAAAANSVENLEDAATDSNGNLRPETMEMIKANLPVVQSALEIDDGGNKAAQAMIKNSVTQNDQSTKEVPDTNYTNIRTANTQPRTFDAQAVEQTTLTQPTDQNQQAAGINLFQAAGWLNGSFKSTFLLSGLGWYKTASIVSGCMFAISMVLFATNKKIKLKF